MIGHHEGKELYLLFNYPMEEGDSFLCGLESFQVQQVKNEIVGDIKKVAGKTWEGYEFFISSNGYYSINRKIKKICRCCGRKLECEGC